MTAWDTMKDGELLDRYVQEQSEEAFAEIVRRHLTLVYSAASRQLGADTHAAQDITQAVFAELARQAARLVRHPVLTGWLYTTTHHLACRQIRGERRRQDREHRAHAMQLLDRDVSPDPQSLRAVLDQAMQDLRETDRSAVLLRYFEGWDLHRVGTALGVSQDAARMRIDRALDRLRIALARRGITATAAALGSTLGAHAVDVVPAGLAGQVLLSSMAASGFAGALPATAGLLSSLTSSLPTMKLPIVLTSLGAALVAVPLMVQHQRVEAARSELAAFQRQVSDLDALRAENDRLRPLAALAQERDALLAGREELQRLRNEAAGLRAVVEAEGPLRTEFDQATTALREAEAARAEAIARARFREGHALTVKSLQHLGIAARVYATDHSDRLPSTFDAMKAQLGGGLPDGASLETYEFFPQPRVVSVAEPQLFLFRERQPRQRPDGTWERGYTMVDGSVQMLTSPTEDFSEAETQSQGIASPDVPEHLRELPAYQAPPTRTP